MGAKKETGRSADRAISVTKRYRSHGATMRVPRRVFKMTRALEGVDAVGVVIYRGDADDGLKSQLDSGGVLDVAQNKCCGRTRRHRLDGEEGRSGQAGRVGELTMLGHDGCQSNDVVAGRLISQAYQYLEGALWGRRLTH